MPTRLRLDLGRLQLLRLSPARLPWALALTQLVSWGIIYYSFSIFLLPMERELGWSRQELLNALSLGLLAAGAAAPWAGAVIDREGGRRLMSAGSLLASLLLVAWAWVDSQPAFYAIWVGLGFCQAATLYEPAFAVLNRQLHDQADRAIVKVTLVAGFASTVFIPLTQVLTSSLSWRPALCMLSLLNLLICLPLHLALPSAPPRASRKFTRQQAGLVLRSLAFWGLLLNSVANGLVFNAFTFHGIPLLLEQGLTAGTAVTVMAVIGPSQVLGRIFMLVQTRHITPTRIGRIAGFLLPLGLTAFFVVPTPVQAGFVFAILYGASNGINTILRGTATAELLGRENYGVVNGMIATPTAVARSLAPALAAILWTRAGNYQALIYALLAVSTAGAVAFWMASFQRASAFTDRRI